MKKLLCFLLCLTLIFSSVSLSFAAVQDVSDSQTHTLLGNLYNLLNGSDFKGRLNNIYNKLVDINSNIVTLMGWLDPSTGGSTTALLNQILNALTYTDVGGTVKSWLVDIQGYNYQTAERILDLKNLDSLNGFDTLGSGGTRVPLYDLNSNGGFISINTNFSGKNWRSNFGYILQVFETAILRGFSYIEQGFNLQQTIVDPLTLQASNFTPISMADGIYKYLKHIQNPVARLSYVLASNERIAAQEAAAANEEAVVDNFIDSSGDGAASTSDFGSVSDLSSGYKQNFGTDASPSGIFDIFNSDHATWFSQETKNQLDTTTPSRMTKGSASETPLLDKQIEDIYDALGVKLP